MHGARLDPVLLARVATCGPSKIDLYGPGPGRDDPRSDAVPTVRVRRVECGGWGSLVTV
jgi:hypothetical protein